MIMNCDQPPTQRTSHVILAFLFLVAINTTLAASSLTSQAFLAERDREHSLEARLSKFVETASPPRGPPNCARLKELSWVRRYIKWHAKALQEEKLKPGSAKFLVFLCGHANWPPNPPITRERVDVCCGIGDRFRGMIELLRLAHYSNRVLLFWWSRPFPLEQAFSPAGDLDWRVHPEYNLNSTGAPVIHWYFRMPEPKELQDGSWVTQHQDQRVVLMNTKHEDHAGTFYPYVPTLGNKYSSARRCAFQMLFKLHDTVEQMVQAQRRAILGNPTQPYVAIHLRLGGIAGEERNLARYDQLKGVLSSIVCARALAKAHNMTGAPIVLLTDNEMLWRMVAAGFFHGVSGPAGEDHVPAHVDQAQGVELARHYASYTDLGLLSQATCLIRSPSGFSDTAWRLGNPMCSALVNDCVDFLRV